MDIVVVEDRGDIGNIAVAEDRMGDIVEPVDRMEAVWPVEQAMVARIVHQLCHCQYWSGSHK